MGDIEHPGDTILEAQMITNMVKASWKGVMTFAGCPRGSGIGTLHPLRQPA
jgi:hypothetical protein